MPDDQNLPQNPIPEENTSPTSPQEPTEQGTENTAHSESSEALPEAQEAPGEGFSDESNNIPPSNSTPTEAEKEPKTEEKQTPNEPNPELVSEPIQAIEPPTAQISTNEPMADSSASVDEPLKSKPEELPPSAPLPEEKPPASPELKSQTSTPTEATPPVASSSNHMRELQVKEQLAIKNKKRKKLDLVMTLFLKKSKNGSTSSPQITNDEVEKFLHVSDATATRYLSILEKEGKIKQNGKTGHMVSYSKI